jgi:hypothetical protein
MPAPLSPARIKQVLDQVRQGIHTREIARITGISMSTIYKVRQRRYAARRPDPDDEPRVAVWCGVCRCHVYPPCQRCRLRAYRPKARLLAGSRPAGEIPLPDNPELRARLEMCLAEVGLPLRTINYLEQQGIMTVGDLLHCRPENLLRLPNFKHKTLARVYAVLERLGFRRGGTSLPADAQQPPPEGR